MAIPKTAHKALFPQAVRSGPYEIQPPTLLHLAALDKLGCFIGRRVTASDALPAGFVLTRSYTELSALMAGPHEAFVAACHTWGTSQPARDCGHLIQAVAEAFNAAFETAVPGSQTDPTKGQPPSSVGPSKSRKR